MAQPSDHASEPSFSVIGPQFIEPYPVELIVQKYACGTLVITNTNHQILLKVQRCDTSFHLQRLLVDANDQPIVLLREKNLSAHKRWVAFRGHSKSDADMIFSTKVEHLIRFKRRVSVILANNDCDLKIEGSWNKRNCTVGDSSTTIAQMHPHTLKETTSGEDKFMVTIQPNMDYAFVVALFAIVDAMENPEQKQASVMAAGFLANVIPVLVSL